MAGKVLEITLKSLTVQHNGEITRQEGRNLLTWTVPADVNRDKFVYKEGTSQPIRKEQLVLKAGQQNGSITFGIREL